MAGKGFDYYRGYSHEQLWQMLQSQGSPWAVEQAAGIWTTARGNLESVRQQLNTAMSELAEYWQGDASDEFQARMRVVYDYTDETERSMQRAEERTLPTLAGYLREAQNEAKSANLDPEQTMDFDEWVERTKGITSSDPEYTEKYHQFKTEHERYESGRHDQLARIVAGLGDEYAQAGKEIRNERGNEPDPSGLPGASAYQTPTTGVFATPSTSSGSSSTGGSTDAGAGGTGSGLGPADYTGSSDTARLPDWSSDDETGPWTLPSYDDVDDDRVGGLAGVGGTAGPPAGPSTGGSVTPAGGGAGALGGAGLFGATAGAGSAQSRGANTGIARGQTATGRSATGTGGRSGTQSSSAGRGSGTSSQSRAAGRGGSAQESQSRAGSSGRGATARAANLNAANRGAGARDEEEESTERRGSWLLEDEFDWRDKTPSEELDD